MRPLHDLRIVDLSQNLAGPYCTQILGELGADVLKIEPPAGDAARAWGPPFWRGDSTLFLSANRNKNSICLDLRIAGDVARLADEIARADVFVQSLRPGLIEALGLGPDILRERHPRLIYVTIGAYGPNGPRSAEAGYDPLMQAHAGLMSVTGHDGNPARVGTSIVDMGTGMWAAIGVLAALRERDATGRGAHVGTALYDSALAWNAYHVMGYLASGNVPKPNGAAFPLIVPYDAFPTRDGRIMIAAANDGLFRKLCNVLELHATRDDERFRTNPARVSHRAEVNTAVADATMKFTSDTLLDLLRGEGIPCAPMQTIDHVVADPQTIASEMLQHVGMAEEPDYTAVALPLRFNGERLAADRIPPARPQR